MSVKGLHGKQGAGVRKEALKDLDAFVEDADAFVVTSVAGIGTDQNCKYRAGFLRLKSGDHAPGPRSAAQKIGRLNRNSDNPLDTFTAPDGTVYDGGVVYVLLPGLPPSLGSDIQGTAQRANFMACAARWTSATVQYPRFIRTPSATLRTTTEPTSSSPYIILCTDM